MRPLQPLSRPPRSLRVPPAILGAAATTEPPPAVQLRRPQNIRMRSRHSRSARFPLTSFTAACDFSSIFLFRLVTPRILESSCLAVGKLPTNSR